ncbi:hypothetical protein DICA4_D28634 [Diutina catenulata]
MEVSNASTSSLTSIEGSEKGLNTSTLDGGQVKNNGSTPSNTEDKKKAGVFELSDEITAQLDELKKLVDQNDNEIADRVNKLVKRIAKVEEQLKK